MNKALDRTLNFFFIIWLGFLSVLFLNLSFIKGLKDAQAISSQNGPTAGTENTNNLKNLDLTAFRDLMTHLGLFAAQSIISIF